MRKARELLAAERAYQGELRRLERRAEQREKMATAHERRQESDDEVRANISRDLISLFERVRRSIRGSDRESRTEAFLRYVEQNPDDAVLAMQEEADRELKKLLAEEKRLAKAMRSPRRSRPSAEEMAAVPF